MLYSSIDFENLMNYRTSQYRQEAAQHRLARQVLRGGQTRNSNTSPMDNFLAALGGLLVTAGGNLQRRAAGCRPLEEAA